MFIRVVRFDNVTAESLDALKARVEGSGGPPPGVKSTGITVLQDREQGTAVVLQHYATAEDMAAAEAIFDAMDPSDTPGRRASVDRCEVALELSAD